MVAIKNLFFYVTAASAVVLPRADYNTVLTDLKTTDTDINTLTSQVNGYTGTGAQTLQIRNQVKKVLADLSTANSDAASATTPTAAQGSQVLAYINSPLLTDTKTALTATKNKRTQFTSGGLKAEVLQDLKDLKTATDKLADTLISKAPTSQLKTDGTTAKNNFDAAFNDAITYYS